MRDGGIVQIAAPIRQDIARAALLRSTCMRAPYGVRIRRLAAWTVILNGKQVYPAKHAWFCYGMLAVLAIDGVRRSELAAGLADV